jgi:hypothetical protein
VTSTRSPDRPAARSPIRGPEPVDAGRAGRPSSRRRAACSRVRTDRSPGRRRRARAGRRSCARAAPGRSGAARRTRRGSALPWSARAA